jgi:hypothetical protein
MKKLHLLIASMAIVAAVAVGYSATKSPMQTPKAQDTCPSGCPAHGSCDCSPCDCVSCSR